jgi:uncharacterized phage protein (TIGR01671 family)
MKKNRFKFRVWRKSDRRFIQNASLTGGFISNGVWEFDSPGVIYQQFTGLLDKNGKEIYAGDIVRYDGRGVTAYRRPGIVSIGEYFTHAKEFYHYGVRVKRIDMEEAYFGLNAREDKDYLIIGNIFENPDLCKN